MFTKNNSIFIFIFSFIFILILGGCTTPSPIKTYTITSTAGTGGSINPAGSIIVSEGSSQTFTITTDIHYRIIDVLIDGISIGPVSNYTFEVIDQNHTIQANIYIDMATGVHNIDIGVDYDTIQEGIDGALKGQTLVIYPGTYYENLLFNNKDITVQSADPSDSTIMAATIIDGGGSGSVIEIIGGDSSTLKGFTIQNGDADYGGGILIENNSTPIIKQNTVRNNETTYNGSGMYVKNSSPLIHCNTITDNTAMLENGGGIYLDHSSPAITGNLISRNVSGQHGGGIYVTNGSLPNISGNTITDNEANYHGGGIYISWDSDLLPLTICPTGWGAGRENIPIGDPLVPMEGFSYTIAGNEFTGNEQGDPLDYTEGSHVYFD